MRNRAKQYPHFILDNKDVKTLRKEVQKPYYKEELAAFYILRPLSIYISRFIASKTSISANNLTATMVIIAFISPILLFLLNNILWLFSVTIFVYYVIYTLDVIDGEVARIKKTTSLYGAYLDSYLWVLLPFYYVVYFYKVYDLLHFNKTILFLIAGNYWWTLFIEMNNRLYIKNTEANSKASSMILMERVIELSFGKPWIIIYFPILYAIDAYLLNIYVYIYASLYLVKNIYITIISIIKTRREGYGL